MENRRECACKHYDGSKCTKSRRLQECKPSSIKWFDERADMINVDEVCEKSSIFGNVCLYITEAQLEELKAGKVICHVDEYGTFIALRKDENNEK